jgi:hypothetical protein
VNMFNPNDRVRWMSANPDGWAGPGVGRVIAFDDSRRGFGNKGRPGPAFCIKLDHNQLEEWVYPHELEKLEEEAAA